MGGKRTCLKASIGLGHNGTLLLRASAPSLHTKIIRIDWSILVATRSSVTPLQAAETDISMSSVMAELLPDESGGEALPASWLRGGMWGEEDLIDVCEIEADILSEEPCWYLEFQEVTFTKLSCRSRNDAASTCFYSTRDRLVPHASFRHKPSSRDVLSSWKSSKSFLFISSGHILFGSEWYES